jgi:hypothetical protein
VPKVTEGLFGLAVKDADLRRGRTGENGMVSEAARSWRYPDCIECIVFVK